MQFMIGVLDHPKLDGLAEDQHRGGDGKRKQHNRHQQQGAQAQLPAVPSFFGKLVGAAKAFHQGQHDA
jgi:hypothetical protein